MPISPDNFAHGVNQPSRSPKQILDELLALRHGKNTTDDGRSIIEVLRSEADTDEDALHPGVGIMKTGTPEEIKDASERKRKLLADELGVQDPHVVIQAIRNLADLLEKAQGNVDISQEKNDIVPGIADALIPVIHSRKKVLKSEEDKLPRGGDQIEHDEDEPPEINAVNQFLFGADPYSTAMEEQFVAFLRHAGELLAEWCDHPDIKAPLPKHVRDHFLPEGGISSPP